MGVKDVWAVKQLVVSAQELHASGLYRRLANEDFFLIRTPKLDHPAVVIVMGQGGMSFGLNIFLGEGAVGTCDAMFNSMDEVQSRMVALQSHMIGYEMVDGYRLERDARKWLKQAKIKPMGDRMYPEPMSIEPGMAVRMSLKDKQTRLLLHLTRGILAAMQDKKFKPCGRDAKGRVLTVELTGCVEQPKATLSWEEIVAEQSLDDVVAPALPPLPQLDRAKPGDVPFVLSGFESSGDNWAVCLSPTPVGVQDGGYQPFALLVASDHAQGVCLDVLKGAGGTELIESLCNLMQGKNRLSEFHEDSEDSVCPPAGLPARLIFAQAQVYESLAPAFEPLGIECIDAKDDVRCQEMFSEMVQDLNLSLLGDVDEKIGGLNHPALFLDMSPADDDIDGWKAVDGYLKGVIHEGFDADKRFFGSRALDRYFGSDADVAHLFKTFRQLMIVDSYAFWFSMHYRSTRKRPTRAETWLEDPEFPEPVKALIRLAMEQGPSLYRVGGIDDEEGKLEFVDLYTGDITIVTDFALSRCMEPGLIVPAVLVPVGSFHFMYAAGPVISAVMYRDVEAFWDCQRFEPGPEVYKRTPHVLGWLWDVVDEARNRPVQLRNTDGHELINHSATFDCSDRCAIEAFLDVHIGFERESDESGSDATWVWFRDGAPTPPGVTPPPEQSGQTTILGRVEMGTKELTLTTNSRERFETVRGILESARGVVLKDVEIEPVEETLARFREQQGVEGSVDHFDASDGESDEFDEQELAFVRDYIAKHYQQWLDIPVPALNDKTPRAAAEDPRLRSKLAAMIRSMPDPVDLGDGSEHTQLVSAPREQLLAQLGLD